MSNKKSIIEQAKNLGISVGTLRNQQKLKNKQKKEEKANRHLIEEKLKERTTNRKRAMKEPLSKLHKRYHNKNK